jgi:EAL domain-containing protein (putative c-di-GMP-specific phosphodiesterase class I)
MEALVRWKHPELGLLSPDKFIPLAEELDLIDDLGEMVLRQACLDAVRWPLDIQVAVNVSPIQFRNSGFARRVSDVLAETRLPAKRLELEITESVLLGRSEDNIRAAIVCAVANLGRTLDIVTTAEGVETKEQLELLRAAGCTQAQGYLFGRPCAVAQLNFDNTIDWTASKDEKGLTACDTMLVT